MAGTLSPSEFLELGSAVGNKYRPHRTGEHDRRSKVNKDDTSVVDLTNTGRRAFYADELNTEDADDTHVNKAASSRRRRLTLLLTCAVVVFVVVLVAVVVVVIVLGECQQSQYSIIIVVI